MSRVILCEGVYQEEKVQRVVKYPLEGRDCESCGEPHVVRTASWGNYQLNGRFSMSHPQRGNTFSIDVCSFKCAQTIYDGGWRKLERYKDFQHPHIEIGEASLEIERMCSVEEAKKRWEKSEGGSIRYD